MPSETSVGMADLTGGGPLGSARVQSPHEGLSLCQVAIHRAGRTTAGEIWPKPGATARDQGSEGQRRDVGHGLICSGLFSVRVP